MFRKLQAFPSFRRSALVAGVFIGLLLSFVGERSASAQTQFGDKGQLAITGENLFGFATERQGESTPVGEASATVNRFGFLYSNETETGIQTPRGPWVGGHYFIIPSLSIGGTIGFESASGSATTVRGNTTVTTDTGDRAAFVFLPKVGYALMFNRTIGFWFRGGPGFARIGYSRPGAPANISSSYTFWLLSLDALFVVSPVQHFAFYVGPQMDLSFSGDHSETNNDGQTVSFNATFRRFGIGLGLIGYFDL